MDAQNSPLITEVYRHRYALDEIKYAVLHASNGLSFKLTALIVPGELKRIHDRTASVRKILRAVQMDLRDTQIEYQRHLPPLPTDSIKALQALDGKLAAHERAAHKWLLSSPRFHLTKGTAIGDWIGFDESIWMTLSLRPELDPVSAAKTKLFLAWRFANVKVRCAAGDGEATGSSPQFFQFGKWADDHFPVDRPEARVLRSDLLKAFLPHVPELAFVAPYVSACTLKLDNGKEWQTSLPPDNFLGQSPSTC